MQTRRARERREKAGMGKHTLILVSHTNTHDTRVGDVHTALVVRGPGGGGGTGDPGGGGLREETRGLNGRQHVHFGYAFSNCNALAPLGGSVENCSGVSRRCILPTSPRQTVGMVRL